MSGNDYTRPAFNFKSQFLCISFKIRTLLGDLTLLSFSLCLRGKKKVVLKRLSQSCEPFENFFLFLFFPFRSLPRWEMRLEMIWETGRFLPLSSKIQPPLHGLFWTLAGRSRLPPPQGLSCHFKGRAEAGALRRKRLAARTIALTRFPDTSGNREGCPLIPHLQRGF